MVFVQQRFTIVRVRKPPQHNLNDELQWFGNALGLFSQRDKDRSAFRIFIELIKAAKLRKPLSSDELAGLLHLSRGTVVHHLNKLKESGIVHYDGKYYWLRDNNLERLIEDMRADVNRTFDTLQATAKELDNFLGL
jgi:predicted transcriptional regulator